MDKFRDPFMILQINPGQNWLGTWTLFLLDGSHNPTGTPTGAITTCAQYNGFVEWWVFDTTTSLDNGFAFSATVPPSSLGAPPSPVSGTAYFTCYGFGQWTPYTGGNLPAYSSSNLVFSIVNGSYTWYLWIVPPTTSSTGQFRWYKPSADTGWLFPGYQPPCTPGKAMPLASSTALSSYLTWTETIPPLSS